MVRMLSGGWEMETYGSLSMSFSMSFSMSLSMSPSSLSSFPVSRMLQEVNPIDMEDIVVSLNRMDVHRRLSTIEDSKMIQQEQTQEEQSMTTDGQQVMIHLSFALVSILIASILVIDLVKRKRSLSTKSSRTSFHDHQLVTISHNS
jgi:hypothetical protein